MNFIKNKLFSFCTMPFWECKKTQTLTVSAGWTTDLNYSKTEQNDVVWKWIVKLTEEQLERKFLATESKRLAEWSARTRSEDHFEEAEEEGEGEEEEPPTTLLLSSLISSKRWVRREIRRTRSVQSLRNMAPAEPAEEDNAEHIPAMSWTRHSSSGVWSPASSSPAIVDAAKV